MAVEEKMNLQRKTMVTLYLVTNTLSLFFLGWFSMSPLPRLHTSSWHNDYCGVILHICTVRYNTHVILVR